MEKITSVHAIEILDSRGIPTIQATVEVGNFLASSSVPSGASTGTHEALELRDGDPKRYMGKGVQKAVKNVNNVIAKALVGMDVLDQEAIDKKMIELDGTDNKSKLGANSILSVSLAAARTAAIVQSKPLYQYISETFGYSIKSLPTPMMNVINGGVHADSGMCIQEFMMVPRAKKFSEKLRIGTEVFYVLKSILKDKKLSVAVGDEGGFAPHLGKNQAALDILSKAIAKAGYVLGKDIDISFDAAASEFYNSKQQYYDWYSDGVKLTTDKMIALYQKWVEKYKIFSIEDGFAEDDFESWKKITKSLGSKTVIVGDDLFVTNVNRLKTGIQEKWANSILIKVNQIGSLSETVHAIKLAQQNKYTVIVSHRSGETNDSFIADLAVGVNAQYVKIGAPSRGERIAKYNRLLEIENELS